MIELTTKPYRIDQTGPFIGRMRLVQTNGPVGMPVMLKGEGLPPNRSFKIVWETYNLDWAIEQREGTQWNEFQGLRAGIRFERLAEVISDGSGCCEAIIKIPEDYGGMHDIFLVDPVTDRALNKCGFRVDLSAQMTPSGGPLGTPIKITLRGLNPIHPLEGWYLICYDNHLCGYATAVRTRGTAIAEIPATGLPGQHLITIEKGSFGEPFLGVETTPYFYTKTFNMIFEVTDGEPVLPPAIQEQIEADVPAQLSQLNGHRPQLWTDPAKFPARMAFEVHGRHFPPGSKIDLIWHDVHGDRVSDMGKGNFGTGFSEQEHLLCQVQADGAGAFTCRQVHDGTQGGPHALEARIHGDTLTRSFVTVARRPHPITPKAGAVGTQIKLEIEGVGWTEYENILAVNYDNAYIGYKCGNDMMGRAIVKLRAAGQRGLHFIDLYPAIYRNKNFAKAMEMPFIYQKPILTWQDHPHGFHFRYTFRVE